MHKDREEDIPKKYKVTWLDRYICLEKGNSKKKEKVDLLKNRKILKALKHLIKEIKRKFVNTMVV